MSSTHITQARRVVILGGYGSFGRLISEALISEPNAQIVVAGRNREKGMTFANSISVQFIQCDVDDVNSLRQVVADAYLVINTTGPFQQANYAVPRIALESNCHYIDLGDGRAYVTHVGELDKLAQIKKRFVCVGASTSPAITTALIAELQSHFSHINTIKIALSAGNKNKPGASTVKSILSYIGTPIKVWKDGRWQEAFGWGESEVLSFPLPVGRRRVQLCDVSELTLVPAMVKVDSVLFKAGLELDLFNYGLTSLAWLHKVWQGFSPPLFTTGLMCFSQLFKSMGTFAGGVAVWVNGFENESKIEKSAAIIAPKHGPQVAATPIILLARKILMGDVSKWGAFPCIGFLPLKEIADYLEPFGIFVKYNDV